MNAVKTTKMSNFRWVICALLFLATTVNYMDRQVLSLTWKDFIAPDFHWSDNDYGTITGWFSIFYAVANLFAGKFIDWMGTKKGYLIAIFVWSLGACLHAFCGWGAMGLAGGSVVALTTISVYLFLACRLILAVGEAGNFPAAIKVTAEFFPKKDRAFATSLFNSGASVGALAAPATIPLLARAWGWEMAFIVIGALGFVWMGLWVWLYDKPAKNKRVNQAELNYIEQDVDIADVQDRENTKEEKTIPFWQCFKYKQTWSFIVHIRLWYGYCTDLCSLCHLYDSLVWWWLSAKDFRREVWHESVCRPYACDVDFRLLPVVGLAGSAFGRLQCLVASYPDWFAGCRSPVLECKHFLNSWRYVPEINDWYHHRYRFYGRRCRLVPD